MTLVAGERPVATSAGLLLGFVADQWFGDPRRGHPVAGFGRGAARLERVSYADHRIAGALHVGLLVGAAVGLGVVAERLPYARTVLTAAATWAVLGGRSLTREAHLIAGQLDDGDLAAARRQVRNLVGRRTEELSADEIARATVESLAENTADAVVAPLFFGAVTGIPGLLGYRAVNTLDAMIGHRSERYLRFGWAAARLDDVANWIPARLAGTCAAVVAPVVGGSPLAVLRIVRRDAGRHPSPNAGVVESAFAAALGVTLGGRNVYGGVVEDRGRLGDGPPAAVPDIARAARLSTAVSVTALGVCVLARLARRRR